MSSPSIRIRLLAFGALKTIVPAGGDWRELTPGSSVADLLATLCGEGLTNQAALHSAAIAVNQHYSARTHTLHDGDEVAILPPVSGGLSSEPAATIALVREPIDAAAIERAIKSGSDGALCVFDGIVRDNTRGRQTLHLDYEAYEEMALKQMHLLRSEAIEHFGVREIAIVHRLGRLTVGETSVFIAVASAPPWRSIRRLPLGHRHPQKDRSHLEARAVRRRRRLGRRRALSGRHRRPSVLNMLQRHPVSAHRTISL